MAKSISMPTDGPMEFVVTCLACSKTYRYEVTGLHYTDDGEDHVYSVVICPCGQRIGYFLLGDDEDETDGDV